ncbi:MAG: cyclic nucleotide-binding domain-containing protein [Alphaproteobacteria bacterium]|nr:cyclic nucleotide-binding domain-containing protein [Alphaproteobacteria bacterium]MCB9791616.1 cyclic nucleotide-binding domain-containing protein [Alphaproteobacteria bacterium]
MGAGLTLESIITFLLETPMFRDLETDELAEIVRIMQIQRVREGQTVFREGEPGDAWYVVHQGEVAVTKARLLGPSEELARLSERTCFGEMALIDGSPRSASVTAVGEGTLFRFPKSSFDTLLAEGNLAAYKLIFEMAKVLCARQRRLTGQLTDVMTSDGPKPVIREKLLPVIEEHSVAE